MSKKPTVDGESNAMRHTPGHCVCGMRHSAPELRVLAKGSTNEEKALSAGMDEAIFTGMFPDPAYRRKFLKAVGAGTALTAVSAMIPGASRPTKINKMFCRAGSLGRGT